MSHETLVNQDGHDGAKASKLKGPNRSHSHAGHHTPSTAKAQNRNHDGEHHVKQEAHPHHSKQEEHPHSTVA